MRFHRRFRPGPRGRAPRRFRVPRPRWNVYLVLVEQRALREPISVELEPQSQRLQPAGFWRKTKYHRIYKLLERRVERGEAFLRVHADRGCFDLHHYTEIDPWTWQARPRWELVAELAAIRVQRRFS